MTSITHSCIGTKEDENLVDDVLMEAVKEFELKQITTVLPSFDAFEASIGKINEVQPLTLVSWTGYLSSCEIIKHCLWENGKIADQFGDISAHKLRVKIIDSATSQLSIRPFFKQKSFRAKGRG